MAAQIIVTQLQTVQNAHMEVFNATREFFNKHPALRGRHKELSEIVTRLEKANPRLTTEQLFTLAAEEMNRANKSVGTVQPPDQHVDADQGTAEGA
jgi:hypothetical protein